MTHILKIGPGASLRALSPKTSKFCDDPDLLSCQIADISSDILGKKSILLPGNLELKFKNKIPGNDNAYNYEGDGASLIVTYNPESSAMSGTATLEDGRTFVLEYIGEEGHLWKEMDIQKLNQLSFVSNGNRGEGFHVQDFIDLNTGNVNRGGWSEPIPEGTTDNHTMAYISVKVYFTKDFAEITNNINDFVDKMIAITNQGFLNSKVPITVIKTCIEETNLKERSSSSQMIEDFKNLKGSTENLRQTADTATLLVADMADSCGIAYFYELDGKALSVVKKSCVETFSYGHELGHNLGCHHNIDKGVNEYYPHGQGYFIDNPDKNSPGYHTMMTYGTLSHPIRINSFSNPAVIYPRVNKITGNLKTANNAAVLLRNRFIMASVGDETQKCFLFNCKNNRCTESSGLKIKEW